MAATETSIEREIKDVERRYWEAVKAGDAKAVADLTAETFTFVMKDGVMEFGRDDYVKMMTGGEDFKLRAYSMPPGPTAYRSIGSDTALAAYLAHWQFERAGKPERHDTVNLVVWVRENGSWRCAAMSEADAKNEA